MSKERRNRKTDISATSAITQKLDALLKAEGFTALNVMRFIGGKGQAVNDIEYMNGEGERVYIFTHELSGGNK
jgi:hypothetical protein